MGAEIVWFCMKTAGLSRWNSQGWDVAPVMLRLHPSPRAWTSCILPAAHPAAHCRENAARKVKKGKWNPHLVLMRQQRLEELYICLKSEIFFYIYLLAQCLGVFRASFGRADFEIKVL